MALDSPLETPKTKKVCQPLLSEPPCFCPKTSKRPSFLPFQAWSLIQEPNLLPQTKLALPPGWTYGNAGKLVGRPQHWALADAMLAMYSDDVICLDVTNVMAVWLSSPPYLSFCRAY